MKKIVFLLLFTFASSIFPANAQMLNAVQPNRDSALLSQLRLRYTFKQMFVPTGLAVAGMATFFNKTEGLKNELVEARNKNFSNFRTHIDNYAQFFPLAVTYGLDAFGVPAKTDFSNRTAIMFKGEALMFTAVTLLKHSIYEMRPDSSNHYSFPSGHTAQAFAAATLLSEEYGYRFKWMPYAAYTLAVGVGTLRMANNKHYICDVLVGAGIGILSMKIAYWTHHYKWGKHKRPMLEP